MKISPGKISGRKVYTKTNMVSKNHRNLIAGIRDL